jgi:predicted dehydrogenase
MENTAPPCSIKRTLRPPGSDPRSPQKSLTETLPTVRPHKDGLSKLPAGHPQGYAQCFENFIDDTYAAVRGEAREGLPTFDDGARSAHIIDAVLDSAKTGQWVTVTDPALLVASELA